MSKRANTPAPARVPSAGKPRFSRDDLTGDSQRPLNQGRWANAIVSIFEHGGETWVVKDFRPRSWPVRNLIGRFLVRRELGALRRLQGVPGTPQDAFRVDAHALAYRFVPGRSLRGFPTAEIPQGFFPALERNVLEMHARGGLVHLDMRNAGNILVTASGEPSIIDFQSHLKLRWLPGPLRRFAARVDRAAIYKHWARRSPDTLSVERRAILDRINEMRPLWTLRGYFGSPRHEQPRH